MFKLLTTIYGVMMDTQFVPVSNDEAFVYSLIDVLSGVGFSERLILDVYEIV